MAFETKTRYSLFLASTLTFLNVSFMSLVSCFPLTLDLTTICRSPPFFEVLWSLRYDG